MNHGINKILAILPEGIFVNERSGRQDRKKEVQTEKGRRRKEKRKIKENREARSEGREG